MWSIIAKSVIFLIIQIAFFSKKCDQHVIRLFNSYHFVQLNNEIFEPKNSQSFQREITNYNHLIITDECSFRMNSILQNLNIDPIGSNFNFISHPILYSNENNRLSFLLSISFDSITDMETDKSFLGYEIKFRNFDNLINCVKIMPDKNDLGKFRKIELVIKDPTFVTQKNKNYTFYFGQISVHILVKCTNNTEYCTESFIHSNELNVGIKSKNSSVDTSIQFNTDMCRGDFNQYTCILRYKSQINEDYFIVIQPGTDQFEYIKGNLNRLIIKNNDSIELRGDEMWPNNLIYKLFQTQSQIFYLGEFKNPTEKNKCFNDMFKRYCDCNNKCTSCSSLYGNNEIIRAVVLEEELESKHCSDYIYSAYSFERLSIEKTFLNEELNKTKNIFNRKYLLRKQKPFYEFNLDFVPRLCLEINPKISQEFSVSLHLNNVNSAPMTNLFNIKHYKITWYSIESNNLKMDSNQMYDIDIYQLFDKTVNLNQTPVKINLNKDNLNKKYLIEFFLEPNNTVCPKANMCIDEYTKNNHIQCIDRDYCTKYFYFLQINEIIPFFSCEQNENNRFSKMVSYNLNDKTNLLSSESNSDESKILFYAAKVPVYFKPNNLKLPLYFINFNILKTSFSSKSQIILLVIFGFFVPIILFSIFLFLYYQAIMFDLFHKEKFSVVFFLSINVSTDSQIELSETIKKFISILKKWFKNIDLDIIMYNTKNRDKLLQNCDLVVYVCVTHEEINDIENGTIKIGQNVLHDEFNKLHFFNGKKQKLIDIALFEEEYESTRNKLKIKNTFNNESAISIPLYEFQRVNVSGRKVFRLPNENKDFLNDFKLKLTSIDKNSNRILMQNCKSKIIYNSKKCLLNFILKRIDNDLSRLIMNKGVIVNFEQVDYGYYNFILDKSVIVN